MATRARIKISVDTQVSNDARARRIEAGDSWATEQLDFYYGVGNEISVDIAIKSAMLRVLEEDHMFLPDNEWAALGHDINSTMVVDNAIDRMKRASLRATDDK